MKKNRKYRFFEKQQSQGGKSALITAGVSAGLFLISVILSFHARGNAGLAAGAPALIGMLLSVCSFFFGVRSFKEKDTAPGFSIAGTIIGGIVMLGWLMVFLMGVR
ncbi:MAG: hypothetical protein E7240_07590 [Lachnospiraceae bacterium]|nr:hypothetical protein [Lachnospiraceae bacterium]